MKCTKTQLPSFSIYLDTVSKGQVSSRNELGNGKATIKDYGLGK